VTDQPTPPELQGRKNALIRLFDRMLPIVDGLLFGVRFTALLGFALVGWIFTWMFYLNDFSLAVSVLVCALASLPLLVLTYFWWSLDELRQLPETIAEMMQGANTELRERVVNIRSGERKKMGLITTARSILNIGSMVGEARTLVGSYLRAGSLMSPLILVLGFLSVLYIIPLILSSLLLALIEVWPW
jgi:hypothetical protein